MGHVPVDLGELVQHWTLVEDERGLIVGKGGATRFGLGSWLASPPWLRWGRRCRFSTSPI